MFNAKKPEMQQRVGVNLAQQGLDPDGLPAKGIVEATIESIFSGSIS